MLPPASADTKEREELSTEICNTLPLRLKLSSGIHNELLVIHR